jgi:hypothetical protein
MLGNALLVSGLLYGDGLVWAAHGFGSYELKLSTGFRSRESGFR